MASAAPTGTTVEARAETGATTLIGPAASPPYKTIIPARPTAPAVSAQPSPPARNGAPVSSAAAAMTTTPAGVEMSSTDAALARRDATPPRKSALPNSAAAASANTITTAGLTLPGLASGRNDIPCSSSYRPLPRRVIIRGCQRSGRCACPHPAVPARRARLVAGPARGQVRGEQGRPGRAGAGALQPEPGDPGQDQRRVRGSGHLPGGCPGRAQRAGDRPGSGPDPVARALRRDGDHYRRDRGPLGGRAVELDGHARRGVRRRRACPGDQGAGVGAGGYADPDRG